MADIPTNAYRVFTDLNGRKQLHFIRADGRVLPLVPRPSDRALPDGYYTRDLKLIRETPMPPAVQRAMKAQQGV